jgi:hypothetical protein
MADVFRKMLALKDEDRVDFITLWDILHKDMKI